MLLIKLLANNTLCVFFLSKTTENSLKTRRRFRSSWLV